MARDRELIKYRKYTEDQLRLLAHDPLFIGPKNDTVIKLLDDVYGGWEKPPKKAEFDIVVTESLLVKKVRTMEQRVEERRIARLAEHTKKKERKRVRKKESVKNAVARKERVNAKLRAATKVRQKERETHMKIFDKSVQGYRDNYVPPPPTERFKDPKKRVNAKKYRSLLPRWKEGQFLNVRLSMNRKDNPGEVITGLVVKVIKHVTYYKIATKDHGDLVLNETTLEKVNKKGHQKEKKTKWKQE